MREPVLSDELVSRLQRVRLLALDVDGVLTDGRITFAHDGGELKSFSARDGMGIWCLHDAGLKSAVITARGSKALERRADELGIEDRFFQCKSKGEALDQLAAKHGLGMEEVAFVGDDLIDLPALRRAGVAFSVAGCAEDVRTRVDYVTTSRPGFGAVREIIELLLKAQGRWDAVLEAFLQ